MASGTSSALVKTPGECAEQGQWESKGRTLTSLYFFPSFFLSLSLSIYLSISSLSLYLSISSLSLSLSVRARPETLKPCRHNGSREPVCCLCGFVFILGAPCTPIEKHKISQSSISSESLRVSLRCSTSCLWRSSGGPGNHISVFSRGTRISRDPSLSRRFHCHWTQSLTSKVCSMIA